MLHSNGRSLRCVRSWTWEWEKENKWSTKSIFFKQPSINYVTHILTTSLSHLMHVDWRHKTFAPTRFKRVTSYLDVPKTRCQFHKHFMSCFCTNILALKTFCACSLALWVFGARILAQKLLVKCWWNWPKKRKADCWLTLRFPFCVYCFPQTLHENGFSPVCVTRWRFIVVTQTKRLPQTPQTGKIFDDRLRTPRRDKKWNFYNTIVLLQ